MKLGWKLIGSLNPAILKKAKEALRSFQRAIEFTMHGPFMEEFMMNSKEIHMMMREVPRILEHTIEKYIDRGGNSSSVKE